MKKRLGQIFLEYGILIAVVATALMLFATFLRREVDHKTNTFQDYLEVRPQQ